MAEATLLEAGEDDVTTARASAVADTLLSPPRCNDTTSKFEQAEQLGPHEPRQLVEIMEAVMVLRLAGIGDDARVDAVLATAEAATLDRPAPTSADATAPTHTEQLEPQEDKQAMFAETIDSTEPLLAIAIVIKAEDEAAAYVWASTDAALVSPAPISDEVSMPEHEPQFDPQEDRQATSELMAEDKIPKPTDDDATPMMLARLFASALGTPTTPTSADASELTHAEQLAPHDAKQAAWAAMMALMLAAGSEAAVKKDCARIAEEKLEAPAWARDDCKELTQEEQLAPQVAKQPASNSSDNEIKPKSPTPTEAFPTA